MALQAPLLVDEPLDLEFLAADASRLVPVQLGVANGAVSQFDGRDALELSPPARSVRILKTLKFADRLANGDGLNVFDGADNDEVHPSGVIAVRRMVVNAVDTKRDRRDHSTAGSHGAVWLQAVDVGPGS